MSTLWNQSLFAQSLWGPSATTTFVSIQFTAKDAIYWAYRLLGVLRPGQTASQEMLSDGLLALNDMMDSWNTERLIAWGITRNVFNPTANVGSYAIGAGQTWNWPRPARIEAAGWISLTNPAQPIEYPLQILTVQRYEEIQLKSLATVLPRALYYDAGFPVGTATLYPIPTVGYTAAQVALYLWQQVGLFADIQTTQYAFPPGYSQAIKHSLAVALMSSVNLTGIQKTDRQQWPLIRDNAEEFKAKIKSLNTPSPELRCADFEYRSGGQFNIATGGY